LEFLHHDLLVFFDGKIRVISFAFCYKMITIGGVQYTVNNFFPFQAILKQSVFYAVLNTANFEKKKILPKTIIFGFQH